MAAHSITMSALSKIMLAPAWLKSPTPPRDASVGSGPADDEPALVLGRHHPLERQVLRGQIPPGRAHRQHGEELHHHGGEIVAGALVERHRAGALRHERIGRALLLVALG